MLKKLPPPLVLFRKNCPHTSSLNYINGSVVHTQYHFVSFFEPAKMATMYFTRSITTDEELRETKIIIRELEALKRKVKLLLFNIDGFEYGPMDFPKEDDMMLDSDAVQDLREFCVTIFVLIEVRPHDKSRLNSIKKVLFFDEPLE